MIRFFNGRTLTMADGVSVTTDEVWTDGGKIAYIGPAPEISSCRASRTRTRTPA